MSKSRNQYVIWQWNCRGYQRKRHNLQIYIDHLETAKKPDVIALQETGVIGKLSGYVTYVQPEITSKPPIATLVRRNIPVIQHNTEIETADHILLEMIGRQNKKIKYSIFVLNVYSNPRQQHKFTKLFKATLSISKNNPLLIIGDFNAPHAAWGYDKETRKGRNLWEDIHQLDLALVTDFTYPTRIGNSVSRDTTPDLSLTKNVKNTQWLNLQEDLGSDHYIVATTITTTSSNVNSRMTRITEWDKFRHIRNNGRETINEITDIDSWVRQIIDDVNTATEEIPRGQEEPKDVDAKLAHMWLAKKRLQQRLQAHKHLRNLRRRIAKLNKQIQDYTRQLANQSWNSLCEAMDRHIDNKKTWHLLRYLDDPENNRTTQKHNLSKLIHTYPGTEQQLIQELCHKYLKQNYPPPRHRIPGWITRRWTPL